jgi:hypothetical protein
MKCLEEAAFLRVDSVDRVGQTRRTINARIQLDRTVSADARIGNTPHSASDD